MLANFCHRELSFLSWQQLDIKAVVRYHAPPFSSSAASWWVECVKTDFVNPIKSAISFSIGVVKLYNRALEYLFRTSRQILWRISTVLLAFCDGNERTFSCTWFLVRRLSFVSLTWWFIIKFMVFVWITLTINSRAVWFSFCRKILFVR